MFFFLLEQLSQPRAPPALVRRPRCFAACSALKHRSTRAPPICLARFFPEKSEEHDKRVHVHAFSLSLRSLRPAKQASQIHRQAKQAQLLAALPGAGSSRDEAMALPFSRHRGQPAATAPPRRRPPRRRRSTAGSAGPRRPRLRAVVPATTRARPVRRQPASLAPRRQPRLRAVVAAPAHALPVPRRPSRVLARACGGLGIVCAVGEPHLLLPPGRRQRLHGRQN